MKVSQDEQKEENDDVNILVKEIKSWKEFEYVLREESALLFGKMLSECGQNKDYVMLFIFNLTHQFGSSFLLNHKVVSLR